MISRCKNQQKVLSSINETLTIVNKYDWKISNREEYLNYYFNKDYDYYTFQWISSIKEDNFQFFFNDGTTISFINDYITMTDSFIPLNILYKIRPSLNRVKGLKYAKGSISDYYIDLTKKDFSYLENKKKLYPIQDLIFNNKINYQKFQLRNNANFAFISSLTDKYKQNLLIVNVGKNNSILFHLFKDDKSCYLTQMSKIKDIEVNTDYLVYSLCNYLNEFETIKEIYLLFEKTIDLPFVEELNSIYFEPKGSYSYLYQIDKLAKQNKRDGKKTIVLVENGDGFSQALKQNISGSSWVSYDIPYSNTWQLSDLRNITNINPYDVPICTSMTDILLYLSNEKSKYDLYFSALQSLENDIPNNEYYNAVKAGNRSVLHSLEAMSLETDRNKGKQVAKLIGLDVLNWIYCESLQDWFSKKNSLRGNKLVVKYNRKHYIGIFSPEEITNNIRHWLSIDKITIEEFAGKAKGNNEINVCFLVYDNHIVPMMFLCEVNKLLDNNTGGKGGNTIAVHDSRIHLYDKFFKPTIKALEKIDGAINQVFGLNPSTNGHLNGWLDISLIIQGDKAYFTEWCIRMGSSNNASIVRQMKTPFPDVLEAIKNKEKFSVEWRTPISVSVDLYCVPLTSGMDADFQITDSLCHPQSLDASFDPIDASFHAYHNGYSVQPNERYGCITGFGSTANDALDKAYSYVEKQTILYGAYRNKPKDIYKFFPYLVK